MREIEVRDIQNNITGKILIGDNVLGTSVSSSVVHSVVVSHLANQRQGTHATKTRAMVSGGGKKPWKQKHAGRARHGSNRSPLWKGGGTTFGPQPRDYSIRLPKKVKREALYKALDMKLSDSEVIVLDAIPIGAPKTKEMVKILHDLGLSDKSVLIVTAEKNPHLLLASRNIPAVHVVVVSDLNAYLLASHDIVVFSTAALSAMQSNEEVIE